MKFRVTPELATLIRTLRAQSVISAKELAGTIGHSPSYLSKLESGGVKMIRQETLTEILSHITEGENFFDDKLSRIVLALSTIVSSDTLLSQGWLIQYDIFERPIRIPDTLAEDIASRMLELGITADSLAETINANRELEKPERYPVNQIVVMEYPQGEVFRLRAGIRAQQIRDILAKTELQTNYGILYSLLFVLVKLGKYGDVGHMEPPEARQVLQETGQLMNTYQIHSLTSYGHILASGEFQSRQLLVLNTITASASPELNRITEILQEAARYDGAEVQRAEENFRQNLEWDTAFVLKVIGMNFAGLGALSFSNKKKLLREIETLLETYRKLPDYARTLEKY